MKVILWFRSDLRISDNPALFAAANAGEVIPIYIYSAEEEGLGQAAHTWLMQAIKTFLPGKLIFRKGEILPTLERVIKESGASALYPWAQENSALQGRDESRPLVGPRGRFLFDVLMKKKRLSTH